MMPFRRILFPTDFSEATMAMVPDVKEMGRRFDAAVTVLNAFNLVPDYILALASTKARTTPNVPRYPILPFSKSFANSVNSVLRSFRARNSRAYASRQGLKMASRLWPLNGLRNASTRTRSWR